MQNSAKPSILRISLYIFIMAFAAISCECSSKHSAPEQEVPHPITQEERWDAQRDFLKKERESIEGYINERSLDMERTGMGLYYTIIKDSVAPEMVESEDRVEYQYKISMLNGSLLFSSENSGNGTLTIDKEDAVIGLHESLKKLGLGDEGLFILPSHLAFGVAGDQDRVPPKTALVYELKIVKIQKSKS